MILCLSVCPELIEELAGATDLKFGMNVEHVVSRNKTKDLSDISTNFWERWQNVLAYQIWGFNLVPLLWPIRFECFNQTVLASIGAVTPSLLSKLVLHTNDPLDSPNLDQYDFALYFCCQ